MSGKAAKRDINEDLTKNINKKLAPLINALNEELEALTVPHDRHRYFCHVIAELMGSVEMCDIEVLGAVERAKVSYMEAEET